MQCDHLFLVLLMLVETWSYLPTKPSNMRCPPGTYMSEDRGECQWCEAGSYQPESGAMGCISCKKGMVSQEPAATSSRVCRNCPRGTYAINSSVCEGCPLNTISPAGAVDILECTSEKGHFSMAGRIGVECPANFYCVQGTTTPTPCPDGTISQPRSTQCTPGVRAVILYDWIFGSAWIILFLSGVLALGVYKNILWGFHGSVHEDQKKTIRIKMDFP
jgi:Tyrosine-protein kinase ephrin type A/B receptor-like